VHKFCFRPGEIKWHLMVASCYRRSGDYTSALEKYKWIHQHFPDDTDCIQFLVKISTDLGLPEREMYEAELKKVNKMKEVQHQRKTSADKSRNILLKDEKFLMLIKMIFIQKPAIVINWVVVNVQ